jgi:hypothetical protein
VVLALLFVRRSFDTFAQHCSMENEEKRMNIDLTVAKQQVYDEVESWIKTAQAKLETLGGQAEGKMAKIEVEAHGTLLPELQAIQEKLQQLRKSSGKQWKQLKTDLERLIADFEKSVKQIEAEAKAS